MTEMNIIIPDFFRVPWLIHADWLQAMAADVAGPDNTPNKSALAHDGGVLYQTESKYTTLCGDVAVIDITGPIFRYDCYYTKYFLTTSLDRLSREFQAAIDDPAIKGVMLNINSPGGNGDSIGEFAEQIYQARNEKPVWAYTGNMAASAAYWLGSAAERLIVSPESEVGSIGVVVAFADYSKVDEKWGVKQVKIVSSQSPNKSLDPTTDAGRSDLQARVDALADRFVAGVARNRGVSTETVLQDFGQGGVLPGAGAVAAGMADTVGYFEYAMSEFESYFNQNQFVGGLSMSEQEKPVAVTVTREYLDTDHKGLVEAIKDEGFQAGVEAERARLQALDGLGATGHEALITKCKYEDPVSAEQAAMKVLVAERQARETAAANLAADADEIPDVPPNPSTEENTELNRAISAIVQGGNSVRGK